MVADVLAKLDKARELTAELQKDWRLEQLTKRTNRIRNSIKRYAIKHPGRYKRIHARCDERRYAALSLADQSVDDFVTFLLRNQTKCPHCFERLVKPALDHIRPIAKGGAHSVDNLILMCKSCNSQKGAKLNWPPAYRFRFKTMRQLCCDDFDKKPWPFLCP